MSAHPSIALLHRGDISGLLALHRSTFGDSVMTTPDTETPPAGVPLALVPQPAQPAPQPTFTPTGRTFSEADLEKARADEKSKLYPQLETMQAELKKLREAEEERTKLAKDADAQRKTEQAEQERLAREAQESEMTAKELLEQQRMEYDQRFAALQAERDSERAQLTMERQYSELQSFRAKRIAEETENIIPELIDLVTGFSAEEIEQSIAGLRDRSARIIEQATGAAQAARQQQRGVPVTAPPGIGPDNSTGYQNYSQQDISNMSFADYAKNRDKFIGNLGRNERGIYG